MAEIYFSYLEIFFRDLNHEYLFQQHFRAYLGNPWDDFFHISYTHHLRGVEEPFGGYDLLSTF